MTRKHHHSIHVLRGLQAVSDRHSPPRQSPGESGRAAIKLTMSHRELLDLASSGGHLTEQQLIRVREQIAGIRREY